MAPILKKFVKHPDETKRYTINYSEWLDDGETITSVTFEVTPSTSTPLSVDASEIDSAGEIVSFFLSAGHDGETYEVLTTATTSDGQVKVTCAQFTIRDC